MAWCPVPYSPLSSDQTVEPLLLASIACDRTGLCISRAGLDMFNETTIALPMRPMRKTTFRYYNKLLHNFYCFSYNFLFNCCFGIHI